MQYNAMRLEIETQASSRKVGIGHDVLRSERAPTRISHKSLRNVPLLETLQDKIAAWRFNVEVCTQRMA
jgi:hypothetical protein